MTEPGAEVAPYEFTCPLTVCVDVKHPHAYLALRPARALAGQLGVAVDWLPFPTAALKAPPPASADEDRGTRHRRLRADYVARDIARYAAVQGLTLNDIYRAVDSTLASAGLLWVRRAAPDKVDAYLARTFDGYWQQTLDIEDAAAMAAVVDSLGADATGFTSHIRGRETAELADLRQQLVAAGVFTVPSFVVEDEVFVGRAHLPMVRWLLTGRGAGGAVR